MSKSREKVVGVVGLYDDPSSLLRAAEGVRDAGFTRWDCHTPFPVHGLDRAMRLKSSPLPTVALTAGLIGVLVAFALTGGLNALHYPIRIAGKPMLSWQAFVPIYFELFVLFSALAIMGSLFVFCGLGRWHSPLHTHPNGGLFRCTPFGTMRCRRTNVILGQTLETCIMARARTLFGMADPSSTVVGQVNPRGCSETRIFGQNQPRSLKT